MAGTVYKHLAPTPEVDRFVVNLEESFFNRQQLAYPDVSIQELKNRAEQKKNLSPEGSNRLCEIARLVVAPDGYEAKLIASRIARLEPHEFHLAKEIIRKNTNNGFANQLLTWARSIRNGNAS